MMAINFPAAAFLASLKGPSQIMYCISQDTGGPVVVYKDANNVQQSINVPPHWPGSTQDTNYNATQQHKEIHHVNIAASTTAAQHQSTIRVEAGSQVATIQIPQIPIAPQTYSSQATSYYPPTSLDQVQAPTSYIHAPGHVYSITNTQNQHTDKNKQESQSSQPQSEAQQRQDYSSVVIRQESEEGKNFTCSLCKKSFRLKSTLIQHERIHLDSRPFVCTFDNTCRKSFRQKSHLIQHSRIHYDSKPFPCSFQGCGKSFRQRAILSQHERIHCDASSHLLYKNVGENGTLWPQDLPYPNEIQPKNDETSCDNQLQKDQYPSFSHSVFGTLTDGEFQKSETKTETTGLQTNLPLYVRCPICQISYKQKSTLLQHGCVHIESRPYPCLFQKCGKRFRQQSHLAQHIRIHKNEKPYRCPYVECQGRCFRQKTILNQHIRIHTNSKPYRCSICGKDFRQQAILSQHEKTHQSHRPFSCPLSNCKRRFINEQDLKKHIENHMNPSKSKKSSRNAHIVKPETSYFPSYMQTEFSQPVISGTQQLTQTSQAI